MTPEQVLKKYWGYDSFRPCQREIIADVLAGRDVLGLMPTGGGKSITFQVPAMILPGLTIVVTPLVSLMKDQVDNLMAHGIRAAYISAALRRSQVRLAYDRCAMGKARILYVSPERLCVESFMAEARTWNISLIVVDEAHCISQWGYDFRPSYLRIRQLRDIAGPDVPVLAVTASATPAVAADIRAQLAFRPGNTTHTLSFDRSNLSYIVRRDKSKSDKALNVLQNTSGSAIVYVRSRARTQELAEKLAFNGISATFYHAGLGAELRAKRQQDWKDGRVRVMVATNAFGMGIDKPDVRTVIHVDVPPSLEEYYQEAGRAGRDGLPAFAVLVVSPADKGVIKRRLSEEFPPIDFIRNVYEKVGAFLGVAVGSGYENVYEFDTEKFCHTFKLQPAMTRGALALLSRAGYFEYCEEGTSRSRVVIDATRNELYTLRLNPNEDAVLTCLLRDCPGILTDFVYVREEDIVADTGLSADTVYQTLLALQCQRILRYVPRKAIPYIFYTTSREATRYIELPRAVYQDRRANAEKRMLSVIDFAFSDDRCRSAILLEYFGEKDVEDCGRCDVCRSRRPKMPLPDDLDRRITDFVAAHPGVHVTDLAVRLGLRREAVIPCVRALAEEGVIAISGMRLTCPRS